MIVCSVLYTNGIAGRPAGYNHKGWRHTKYAKETKRKRGWAEFSFWMILFEVDGENASKFSIDTF